MYKVCKISDTCKRNTYVYGTPLVCHMFVIHVILIPMISELNG